MLAIDDILDIQYDLEFCTLTPIFSKYYYNHSFLLPEKNSDFSGEIEETRCERDKLKETLALMCSKTNFRSDILFNRIDELWKRIWN